MYRCPRCFVELPGEALFCPRCGFNQTNARIIAAQKAKQSAQAPTPSEASANQQAEAKTSNRGEDKTRATSATPPAPINSGPSVPAPAANQAAPKGKSSLLSYASTPTASPRSTEPAQPPLPQPRQQQQRGGSLTQRYLAEQSPGYQAGAKESAQAPQGMVPAATVPQPPASEASWRPPMPAAEHQEQRSEQVVRTSTPRPSGMGEQPMAPQAMNRPSLWDEPSLDAMFDNERISSTSKAAEHWRKSWWDRQKAEAGPAIGVVRGQAAVAEPLMRMQHSIARMRAIISPSLQAQQNSQNFGYWFYVVLVICLSLGLSGYLIYSLLPLGGGSHLSTKIASQTDTAPQPTLTLQGVKSVLFAPGQTIKVQGTDFTPDHTVVFMLNSNQVGSAQSNGKGDVSTSITIPSSLESGNYALEGLDNQAGQHAYLDIQIVSTSSTTTSPLSASPTTVPPFTARVGTTTMSAGQIITLTNPSNGKVTWSAMTLSDATGVVTGHNLNWLTISNQKIGGQINPGASDTLTVNAVAAGLPASTKPYKGYVLIQTTDEQNQKGQLLIPASLTVTDTSLEVLVNPNPFNAIGKPDGTCQPANLTLINLSNQVVNWSANPDTPDIIKLAQKQGVLQPSGQPNDTVAIPLTCSGITLGKPYTIRVFYNNQQIPVILTARSF